MAYEEQKEEIEAASESFRRLERIEIAARGILGKVDLSRMGNQNSIFDSEGFHIELTYDQVPKQTNQENYGKRLTVQATRLPSAKDKGSPDTKEALIVIRYDENEQYELSINYDVVWKTDMQLPSNSHGDILESLHMICTIIESHYVENLKEAVERQQEETRGTVARITDFCRKREGGEGGGEEGGEEGV